jgi:hypothetical protein
MDLQPERELDLPPAHVRLLGRVRLVELEAAAPVLATRGLRHVPFQVVLGRPLQQRGRVVNELIGMPDVRGVVSKPRWLAQVGGGSAGSEVVGEPGAIAGIRPPPPGCPTTSAAASVCGGWSGLGVVSKPPGWLAQVGGGSAGSEVVGEPRAIAGIRPPPPGCPHHLCRCKRLWWLVRAGGGEQAAGVVGGRPGAVSACAPRANPASR